MICWWCSTGLATFHRNWELVELGKLKFSLEEEEEGEEERGILDLE
jgi:hypothetical protein